MTYDDIMSMMTETGLPFAYDHFAEGESPPPPFLIFLLPGTDNFMADGVTYAQISEVAVELYTDLKLPPLERKLEQIFEAHEIPWDKHETWIEEEKLYEVRYEFDTLYEWEEDEDSPEPDEDEDDG